MGDSLLLVDMDGVLVDFHGGAYRHFGWEPPAKMSWDFFLDHGVSAAEFWGALDASFWAGLQPTAEFGDLLAGLEALVGPERIGLLSSPSRTGGSLQGKADWVRRHMPAYSRRLLLGAAKHFVAGPNKLLIDDLESNVTSFRAHGGAAVLVPRDWNARSAEAPGNRFDVGALLGEVRAALS